MSRQVSTLNGNLGTFFIPKSFKCNEIYMFIPTSIQLLVVDCCTNKTFLYILWNHLYSLEPASRDCENFAGLWERYLVGK